LLLSKFTQQVEQIFKNLPKPVEGLFFYLHGLPLLMDFCEENPQLSIRNHMNSNEGTSQFHVKPNGLFSRSDQLSAARARLSGLIGKRRKYAMMV
jgi:hypothetical protein